MAVTDALERAQGLMAHAQPRPLPTIAEFRVNDDNLFTQFCLPEAVVEEAIVGGVPGLWVSMPGVDTDRAVLYVHGGGFVIGSALGRTGVAAALGRAANCRVFCSDYRLAPEHPYPAGLDDTVAQYAALAEELGGDRIALSGDSSGAALAVSTLLRAHDLGLPKAACLALFSPLVDLRCEGGTWEKNRDLDPVVVREIVLDVTGQYIGDVDPLHPYISPIFGDLSVLPPVQIAVGGREVLIGDCEAFVAKARAAGIEADVRVFDDMFHNWQMFGPILPEGFEVNDFLGAFVAEKTKG